MAVPYRSAHRLRIPLHFSARDPSGPPLFCSLVLASGPPLFCSLVLAMNSSPCSRVKPCTFLFSILSLSFMNLHRLLFAEKLSICFAFCCCWWIVCISF
ncbi:hypothetical protein O6P43_032206 [Quillaja saponaria]|uniref:Uncharacterized protein n=1 Tax=Quillaja saponaria TaxID=32244 RepID=A0AAD7KYQ8_QUISA|nr:hypothetical protein O6P43_032206 [Quillaja saponaria]